MIDGRVLTKLLGGRFQSIREQSGTTMASSSWAPVMDLPKPYTKRQYYTAADVGEHSKGTADCWVSFFGKVYDLAPLLADHKTGTSL